MSNGVQATSVPPTSATLSTLPFPVSQLYVSKARASAVAGTEPVLWLDQIGGRLHAATIGAHSKTSLTITAAAAPSGSVVYDLTGDGTANIPVVIGDP